MSDQTFFEVEHTQKRLMYYCQLREKFKNSQIVEKWIQIYSDRLDRLQAHSPSSREERAAFVQ